MSTRKQRLAHMAELHAAEKVVEAARELSRLLLAYGKLTGRPEAFEAALALSTLDLRNPHVLDALDASMKEMVP